jgi:signal transduction histidine kinase
MEKTSRELSELSTYLQRAAEAEKSALARELHDELGSLLLGIKMDLTRLRESIDLTRPEIKTRWERIQSSLSAGIDLKRRVIERLRPSLLDNLGLIAAVRWQAEEICSAAGLTLTQTYPDSEPEIVSDAAIAIFRIAQETLTNCVKHANAKEVKLNLSVTDDHLRLNIEDDGVGDVSRQWSAPEARGIAGMKHRLLPFDGVFDIQNAQPTGTRVSISLPMNKIAKGSEETI